MATIILRLGYACAPRRRAEVVAALRAIDAIGAPAGWPPGRYLLVDTRGAGEPDLEVEYPFASLADLEQREGRLRDQLRQNSREGGPDTSAWQASLIAPGTRRLLTLVDDAAAPRASREPRPPGAATQARPGPSVDPASDPSSTPGAPVEDDDEDDDVEPDEEPIEIDPSSLTPERDIPAPLPPEERLARVSSILREASGVRLGFGDGAKPPAARARPPRRDD